MSAGVIWWEVSYRLSECERERRGLAGTVEQSTAQQSTEHGTASESPEHDQLLRLHCTDALTLVCSVSPPSLITPQIRGSPASDILLVIR